MGSSPFLQDRERRPLHLPEPRGLRSLGLALGKGPNALEIAITESDRRPSAADLRAVWRTRLAGRATPLLVVALYPSGETADKTSPPGSLAALCGPSGEHPPVIHDLEPTQAERICASALDEPDRHAALRFLLSVLPDLGQPVVGLHNEGLFATYELHEGVPRRSDWLSATEKGSAILEKRGKELLGALGFTIDPLPGQVSILRAAGTKVAVALLLERGELPEAPGPLFAGVSPIAYAMAKADEERVRYVLVSAGPSLRLYPTGTGVGTGRRGRTETYVELRLNLLDPTHAGYLWLLFSADALRDGGTVEQVLEHSRDYAADLGKRLRERIHAQVIPGLAKGIMAARRVPATTADDLAVAYQMALTTLFRLLFVAYAEDKGLLPYRTNDLYRRRSLKEKARELLTIIESGALFSAGTTHWEEIQRLFRAVDRGMREWGIPEYNGGLFSSDPDVSPLGAELNSLSLDNRSFGPALAELLLDETPDGTRGPVDFRTLGVREFGTIYEGLLENELSIAEVDLTVVKTDETEVYRPVRRATDRVAVRRGEAYLHTASGARKATGSFFTKHFAVEHLLDQALEPALEAHIARLDSLTDDQAAAEAFFDFRVADIAMGSGHFLVAAVDRIERALGRYLARRPLHGVGAELARLRSAAKRALAAVGLEADIEDTQLLRRQIARRCIYGVDLNPMAVELARVSLWIHTFVPGLPLSFLDHNMAVGNSLVGIATIEEAQNLLREICETPAGSLIALSADPLIGSARKAITRLARLSDATGAEIAHARGAFKEARDAVAPAAALFDVLTAARIDDDVAADVARYALDWVANPSLVPDSPTHRRVQALLKANSPLHFPIRFPEVFLRERAGFDVIVGNPPWNEATIEEDQFWSRHFPGLRALSQAQQEAEKRRLRRERPDLVAAYQRERERANLLRTVLTSGPFPGMGTGDPDVYKAFAWRFWQLVANDGAIGVVFPRSIFTTLGSAPWRVEVLPKSNTLIATCRNTKQWLFDDVNPGYTICLTSFRGAKTTADSKMQVAGVFHSFDEYRAWKRSGAGISIRISDLQASDPQLSVPAVESAEELRLFESLLRLPRFGDPGRSDWRARPVRELDATNARKACILGARGDSPVYNHINIGHFRFDPTQGEFMRANFRKACAYLQAVRVRSSRNPKSAFAEMPSDWNRDPSTLPVRHPRVAFRDVVHATNPRKVWAALVPADTLLTNSSPYLLFVRGDIEAQAFVLAMLNSSICDWFGHLRIGLHLNFFILDALPIPTFEPTSRLARRAVELAVALATFERDAGPYRDWGHLPGFGAPVNQNDAVAEVDAIASILFDLTDDDLPLVWRPELYLRPPLELVVDYRKFWQRRR